MSDKPFVKVSLGVYLKRHKGPGQTAQTWTINDKGIAPLSSILLSCCEPIINMAAVIMDADEVVAQVKAFAKIIEGITFGK